MFKHISLIGLKSCGKSSLGKILAPKLSLPYVDTDTAIEELYATEYKQQLNFAAIYQTVGPVKFRRLEEQAISDILTDKNPCLIATGGSSLLNKNNLDSLCKNSFIIYLEASKQTLAKRWRQSPPSFINADNIDQELDEYYSKRASLYKNTANITINVDDKTIINLADEIIKAISNL
jgi:shikimate kinase